MPFSKEDNMLFWKFVKSNPNEYLVIGYRGKIRNLGTGASKYLTRGATHVVIPSTKQEASFNMTQESKDGIPLRFKGIVIYRVTDPVKAANLFDFTKGSHGHDNIKAMLSDICLGELRAVVSEMTMEECIEQRKTTLTNSIASELRKITQGKGSASDSPQDGWGVEVDVVQVAQVFIVDDELRRQLEADLRNEIKAKSDLSDIRTEEEVQFAQISSARKLEQEKLETEKQNTAIAKEKLQLQQAFDREKAEADIRMQEEIKLLQTASERKLQQEALETERQNTAITQEKLHLQQELEQQKSETEASIRLLQLKKRCEMLTQHLEERRLELEMRQIEKEIKDLEIQTEMFRERAQHELRKEILPIEQTPEIAEALSQIFQGVNLSIYSEDSRLLSTVGPILDLLTNTLRKTGFVNASEPSDTPSSEE
jgi:hypothetical protein